jgi:hypothetical protein
MKGEKPNFEKNIFTETFLQKPLLLYLFVEKIKALVKNYLKALWFYLSSLTNFIFENLPENFHMLPPLVWAFIHICLKESICHCPCFHEEKMKKEMM